MKVLKKPLFHPFITFWTLLRLSAVTLIWWNPLWGTFINILLDAVDGDILEKLKVKRAWYSRWDKLLDLWFYLFLAIYTYLYIFNEPLKIALLTFFFYRLIGSIIFTFLKKEWILFVFPNVFSHLFLLYFIFEKFTVESYFMQTNLLLILTILTIISFFKEWWIHIAKLDITDLITGKKTRWK